MRIQPLLLSHLWKSTQNTITLRQDIVLGIFLLLWRDVMTNANLKRKVFLVGSQFERVNPWWGSGKQAGWQA